MADFLVRTTTSTRTVSPRRKLAGRGPAAPQSESPHHLPAVTCFPLPRHRESAGKVRLRVEAPAFSGTCAGARRRYPRVSAPFQEILGRLQLNLVAVGGGYRRVGRRKAVRMHQPIDVAKILRRFSGMWQSAHCCGFGG